MTTTKRFIPNMGYRIVEKDPVKEVCTLLRDDGVEEVWTRQEMEEATRAGRAAGDEIYQVIRDKAALS